MINHWKVIANINIKKSYPYNLFLFIKMLLKSKIILQKVFAAPIILKRSYLCFWFDLILDPPKGAGQMKICFNKTISVAKSVHSTHITKEFLLVGCWLQQHCSLCRQCASSPGTARLIILLISEWLISSIQGDFMNNINTIGHIKYQISFVVRIKPVDDKFLPSMCIQDDWLS